MELITVFLELIKTAIGQIPNELVTLFILSTLLYIIRKIAKLEKTVADNNIELRVQLEEHRKEREQAEEQLQIALNKLSVNLTAELQKQEEGLKENYLLSLRTAIINESFPVHYRLEKYDEYKALGGNSFIDSYVRKELINKSGE